MMDDLALANALADSARRAILPFYRAGAEVLTKADASPVTAADRAAEAAMRALLNRERPGDGIIGEEYGAEREQAARVWVLDPIDGTTSFMAGRPSFTTLIALMQDGFPMLGVIDQPVVQERWTGMVGQPTRMNGAVVRTRACPALAEAVLATTSPHLFDAHQADHFLNLAARTNPRRILYGGDAYLYALLAQGGIDLVVEAGLKLHDFAALAPIVEGAGGWMGSWTGDPLTRAADGTVIACGDAARVEEVLEALACHH